MKQLIRILLTGILLVAALSVTAFAEEEAIPTNGIAPDILIAPNPANAPDIVIAPNPGIAPAPSTLPFTDVDVDYCFRDAVEFVYDSGVMVGLSDTEFGPNDTLTRAMLVTILYRFEGKPAFMNDLIFTDVERDSYYEKAVVWAQGKGIVNGVSATEFAPNDDITREQLAAILYRYANYKGIDLESGAADTNTLSFDDFMNISEYAANAVHLCLANQILYPRTTETIQPDVPAYRGEAAQGIYGLANLVTGEDPAQLSYADLAGEYQDSFSGRAVMVASEVDDGLQIVICWTNSAFDYVQWTMTASYDENGNLTYQDCEKTAITTDENGGEVSKSLDVEKNGFFSLCDGVLMWDGAAEENCQSFTFEKIAAE